VEGLTGGICQQTAPDDACAPKSLFLYTPQRCTRIPSGSCGALSCEQGLPRRTPQWVLGSLLSGEEEWQK
jgi:hypothetical protein